MTSKEFKAYAKTAGVKLYQVAERLGIRPSEFSVQYMRHDPTPEEEAMLLSIVAEIQRGRE